MKKLLAILFILLFFVGSVYAFQGSTSSGEQTADAAVFTGRAYICAVHVITDGMNDATLVIYDNTAGSGKVVSEIFVSGGSGHGGRVWAYPVFVENGLYADVTGTDASYIIEYIRE